MDRKKIIVNSLIIFGLLGVVASMLVEAFTDSTVNYLWMIGSILIFSGIYIDHKSQTKGEDILISVLCIIVIIMDVLRLVFEFI